MTHTQTPARKGWMRMLFYGVLSIPRSLLRGILRSQGDFSNFLHLNHLRNYLYRI